MHTKKRYLPPEIDVLDFATKYDLMLWEIGGSGNDQLAKPNPLPLTETLDNEEVEEDEDEENDTDKIKLHGYNPWNAWGD